MAMAPEAPGLDSTITGVPRLSCRPSASTRASMSALPPAGPATTRRMDLPGQAGAATAMGPKAMAARPTAIRRAIHCFLWAFIMGCLLVFYVLCASWAGSWRWSACGVGLWPQLSSVIPVSATICFHIRRSR
ncbi:hypothetical protein D3C72_1767750 [compost metagenome]